MLLLTDRIDEWLMSYLTEFDGKQFVDVARGDLDLGKLDSEEDKKAQEEIAKASEGLIERLKGAGEEAAEVGIPPPHRLAGHSCHWRAGSRAADAPDSGGERAEGAGVRRSSRSIRSTR